MRYLLGAIAVSVMAISPVAAAPETPLGFLFQPLDPRNFNAPPMPWNLGEAQPSAPTAGQRRYPTGYGQPRQAYAPAPRYLPAPQQPYRQPQAGQPAYAQPQAAPAPTAQSYGGLPVPRRVGQPQAAQPQYQAQQPQAQVAQPAPRRYRPVGFPEPAPAARTSIFGRLFGASPQPTPASLQPAAPSNDIYLKRTLVAASFNYEPGTVIVDTDARFLYLMMEDGMAMRYGVGVGRQGFEWKGDAKVGRKAEWPDWVPPKEMREREPWLPERVPGGEENPLGARALYLYEGGKDTLYRIHGTNQPETIGQALSSGCIRMLNQDVMDLYQRVPVGAKVVVI